MELTFFQPKGTRASSTKETFGNGNPAIKIDPAAQDGGLVGIQLNQEAIDLMAIEVTGNEYLAFVENNGRIFFTVTDKETLDNSKTMPSVKVGKTRYNGNSKAVWTLLTESNFANADDVVKIVETSDATAAQADRIYEVVPFDSTLETSNEADTQEPEAQEEATQETETTTFEGF